MKKSEAALNQVMISDTVSSELHKLRLVYIFLSEITDTSHEEGVQFIGRWNTEFLDAAVLTLGESIDNIEEVISRAQ